MKRLYTILVFALIPAIFNTTAAQNCGFAQTGIKYNSSSTDPITGNCIINVDIFFDLYTNSGSKFVTVHIWPKTSYPTLTYANPPDATQLAGAVTLVVDHFQDHDYAYMDDLYLPDPNVHPQYIGMDLTIGPSSLGAGYDRFTITNVKLEVPGECGIPHIFTMDVWATESASMNTLHCLNTGKDFYANNPKINGAFTCGPPRTYNFSISSIDPTPLTVKYDVYIDNGDATFNKVEDLPIRTQSEIPVSSSVEFNSGNLSIPFTTEFPSNRMLWVEVSSITLPNTVIYGILNPCTLLPIELKSFSAEKLESSVLLKWVTSAESGNKGFFIERKSANREWQTIGFIGSLAKGGISYSDISYSYTDQLIEKGVIQYRLRQTDQDGKFMFSPIRVIKNEGINVILVYPNPSNGEFNIVFNDSELNYQVSVYNAEAKMLKNFQNCRSVLNISGLKPGIYLVRIENLWNKEIITKKIIIQ